MGPYANRDPSSKRTEDIARVINPTVDDGLHSYINTILQKGWDCDRDVKNSGLLVLCCDTVLENPNSPDYETDSLQLPSEASMSLGRNPSACVCAYPPFSDTNKKKYINK